MLKLKKQTKPGEIAPLLRTQTKKSYNLISLESKKIALPTKTENELEVRSEYYNKERKSIN
jgi:hypothetical protein